jgi:PTH1 family peptidyl-tRNA hydrolase
LQGLVGRTSPLERWDPTEHPGVKAIVGLGNPGGKYERTRHNAGFLVLDRLAAKHGWRFNQKRDRSLVARGRLGEVEVVLAKPQTYMNLSGQAVQRVMASHGTRLEDLLVVYDDFDLPLGRIRLRERGGPGTHNGMKSIVGTLGKTDFPRLRLGIGGAEPGAARDHVLGDFDPADWETFEDERERAVEAIETYLREGLTRAMNRFNG